MPFFPNSCLKKRTKKNEEKNSVSFIHLFRKSVTPLRPEIKEERSLGKLICSNLQEITVDATTVIDNDCLIKNTLVKKSDSVSLKPSTNTITCPNNKLLDSKEAITNIPLENKCDNFCGQTSQSNQKISTNYENLIIAKKLSEDKIKLISSSLEEFELTESSPHLEISVCRHSLSKIDINHIDVSISDLLIATKKPSYNKVDRNSGDINSNSEIGIEDGESSKSNSIVDMNDDKTSSFIHNNLKVENEKSEYSPEENNEIDLKGFDSLMYTNKISVNHVTNTGFKYETLHVDDPKLEYVYNSEDQILSDLNLIQIQVNSCVENTSGTDQSEVAYHIPLEVKTDVSNISETTSKEHNLYSVTCSTSEHTNSKNTHAEIGEILENIIEKIIRNEEDAWDRSEDTSSSSEESFNSYILIENVCNDENGNETSPQRHKNNNSYCICCWNDSNIPENIVEGKFKENSASTILQNSINSIEASYSNSIISKKYKTFNDKNVFQEKIFEIPLTNVKSEEFETHEDDITKIMSENTLSTSAFYGHENELETDLDLPVSEKSNLTEKISSAEVMLKLSDTNQELVNGICRDSIFTNIEEDQIMYNSEIQCNDVEVKFDSSFEDFKHLTDKKHEKFSVYNKTLLSSKSSQEKETFVNTEIDESSRTQFKEMLEEGLTVSEKDDLGEKILIDTVQLNSYEEQHSSLLLNIEDMSSSLPDENNSEEVFEENQLSYSTIKSFDLNKSNNKCNLGNCLTSNIQPVVQDERENNNGKLKETTVRTMVNFYRPQSLHTNEDYEILQNCDTKKLNEVHLRTHNLSDSNIYNGEELLEIKNENQLDSLKHKSSIGQLLNSHQRKTQLDSDENETNGKSSICNFINEGTNIKIVDQEENAPECIGDHDIPLPSLPLKKISCRLSEHMSSNKLTKHFRSIQYPPHSEEMAEDNIQYENDFKASLLQQKRSRNFLINALVKKKMLANSDGDSQGTTHHSHLKPISDDCHYNKDIEQSATDDNNILKAEKFILTSKVNSVTSIDNKRSEFKYDYNTDIDTSIEGKQITGKVLKDQLENDELTPTSYELENKINLHGSDSKINSVVRNEPHADNDGLNKHNLLNQDAVTDYIKENFLFQKYSKICNPGDEQSHQVAELNSSGRDLFQGKWVVDEFLKQNVHRLSNIREEVSKGLENVSENNSTSFPYHENFESSSDESASFIEQNMALTCKDQVKGEHFKIGDFNERINNFTLNDVLKEDLSNFITIPNFKRAMESETRLSRKCHVCGVCQEKIKTENNNFNRKHNTPTTAEDAPESMTCNDNNNNPDQSQNHINDYIISDTSFNLIEEEMESAVYESSNKVNVDEYETNISDLRSKMEIKNMTSLMKDSKNSLLEINNLQFDEIIKSKSKPENTVWMDSCECIDTENFRSITHKKASSNTEDDEDFYNLNSETTSQDVGNNSKCAPTTEYCDAKGSFSNKFQIKKVLHEFNGKKSPEIDGCPENVLQTLRRRKTQYMGLQNIEDIRQRRFELFEHQKSEAFKPMCHPIYNIPLKRLTCSKVGFTPLYEKEDKLKEMEASPASNTNSGNVSSTIFKRTNSSSQKSREHKRINSRIPEFTFSSIEKEVRRECCDLNDKEILSTKVAEVNKCIKSNKKITKVKIIRSGKRNENEYFSQYESVQTDSPDCKKVNSITSFGSPSKSPLYGTPDRRHLIGLSKNIRSSKLHGKISSHLSPYLMPVYKTPLSNKIYKRLKYANFKLENKQLSPVWKKNHHRCRDKLVLKQNNQDKTVMSKDCKSPETLSKVFDENFYRYAKEKKKTGDLISCKKSTVWLKDAGIVDQNLTGEDAEKEFKNFAGAKIALNKNDYKRFLLKLAKTKKLSYNILYEHLCKEFN